MERLFASCWEELTILPSAPSAVRGDEGHLSVAELQPDSLEQHEAFSLLQTCQPVTHAEITEKLLDGGALKGAVLEAQDDSKAPKYAVFLLPSWRRGYCILHVHWPARPRLYRDLDRLLVLIRFDYGYTGTIALKRASDVSRSRRYWRVKL